MKMVLPIQKIKDKISLRGRCALHNGKIVMDWVGSGFEIRFTGDFIRVFFETESGDMPVYVYSEVDGRRQKTAVSNSNEAIVADKLGSGVHTFKLLRITEVYSPIDNIKDYLLITGIELGKEGEFELWNAPEPRKTVIDFYGDSITNAWSSLAEPDCEERRICDNDYTVSYAYLTSEALNAEARVCAVSGRGVVASCTGERTEPLKRFYNMKSRFLPIGMDFSPKPDIIVIALGTNDCGGGVSDDEFKEGAREFVKLVRTDAKDAEIIWMYGMMNEKYVPILKELIDELKQTDSHISFLPIKHVKREDNETGAFGHPNIKGEKRIADELIKHISKVFTLNQISM